MTLGNTANKEWGGVCMGRLCKKAYIQAVLLFCTCVCMCAHRHKHTHVCVHVPVRACMYVGAVDDSKVGLLLVETGTSTVGGWEGEMEAGGGWYWCRFNCIHAMWPRWSHFTQCVYTCPHQVCAFISFPHSLSFTSPFPPLPLPSLCSPNGKICIQACYHQLPVSPIYTGRSPSKWCRHTCYSRGREVLTTILTRKGVLNWGAWLSQTGTILIPFWMWYSTGHCHRMHWPTHSQYKLYVLIWWNWWFAPSIYIATPPILAPHARR